LPIRRRKRDDSVVLARAQEGAHPQTDGMVERFNGRINELLQKS
jgi:hypothetical protein